MELSCDDKARVPIGITAANAQSPLVMHMEYKVTLPDHDFVIAEKHKLIPSVYAGINIKEQGYGQKDAITYSGPTYVAVRSGKHNSSTAFSHAKDFNRLYELKEFDTITKRPDNTKKPIGIILTDGGPDENPRYLKTIQNAINHFVSHNFDALFLSTNAPGRSAYNPVERRMAPLSKELTGVLLPHDIYGSHLDNSKRTIDFYLEKKNFQAAGEVLAEVFSSVVIDGYDVVSEFVEQISSATDYPITKDGEWFDQHVRSSQYLLQIVKCKDISCCSEFRSSYYDCFPLRFIPPPFPLNYDPNIQLVQHRNANNAYKYATLFQNLSMFDSNLICYDEYCPSLSDKLKQRTCNKCGMYYASTTLLKNHKKEVHRDNTKEKNNNHKPEKIIKKRGNEYLGIIEDNTNELEVEWIECDESEDLEDQWMKNNCNDEVTQSEIISCLPKFSLEEHFIGPWTNK
jgi:hypothetical protein